ncbi:MAG: HEPN domain-containing protein [Deltaproteobacteria bacterium]|nr:HEPN domain-containing protein [Deltaproteobacteria bacterium]
MLSRRELKQIARARLKDAEVLFGARRYDGASYLCGYAVEIALKAKICETLKWKGFPSTNKEFENYHSFKTHSLDVLLTLSGVEEKIKKRYLAEWSVVAEWDPEARYKPVGNVGEVDSRVMIESTKTLMRAL